MNASHIATAFEMLADEFEQALAETNQKGSEAFLGKDYAVVAGLADAAKRLADYQARIAAIEDDWSTDPLFHSAPSGKKWTKDQTVTPAAFHAQCIEAVQKSLRLVLTKETRSMYVSGDGTTAVVLCISREHSNKTSPYYWFSFHPYQAEFFSKHRKGLLVLGCGSAKNILVIPFSDFEPWSKRFNRTERNDTWYSHIRITADSGSLLLHLSGRGERVEVTKYRLK